MRRCAGHGLTPCEVRTALRVAHRTAISVSGRTAQFGFSQPQGKAPRVKHTLSNEVPQRIAGTTKVRYTNNKGRTFTFSIPVTQLTHPPVNRRGASADGWHEIDTSFSDVGNLEDDMPTEIDERLAEAGVRRGEEDEVIVEVNAEQLQGLQEAFVQLCKDYVLMDMSGMKTSMMYSELNNGPDYEHYDRKTRRRRHWLAVRHRFEDVRELLWPSNAAAEMCREDETADAPPLLPVAAMMEALSWAEAASTFAVRQHRPYDTAAEGDFASLDLSREVRVVAECLGAVGPSSLDAAASLIPSASPATSSAQRSSGPVPADGVAVAGDAADAAARRVASDRFISFAALCANHGVPLSVAFTRPPASGKGVTQSKSTDSDPLVAAQTWLCSLPALTRVKDVVRVLAVLEALAKTSAEAASAAAAEPHVLTFSDADGNVVKAELLSSLCRLVTPSLFPHAAALENVDEHELCVLLRFATELQEQNTAFMQASATTADDAHRQVLQHFTQLVLTRCRQLLYKTDGVAATLISGDEENIPLVDLQAVAEHHHPFVRVHTRIGEANAQGLRHARLQPAASAVLAQLLGRIEGVNGGLGTRTHSLRADLLHHIAHKAALGKTKLSLEDVTRALPLLADQMRQTSEQQVKARFDRLFAAMSTSIAVGLQQPQKPSTVLNLLEGLAACHYMPSSYKLLEMVTLRLLMHDGFTLAETARVLVALLQIVGPHGVSQAMQQAVAMRVVVQVEKAGDVGTASIADVCAVLRALRFSLYPSFPSLMLLVARSPLSSQTDSWPPLEHVRYAVLLTAAAGALSSAEDADAEVVDHLTHAARAALQRCREATEGLVQLEGGEDVHQEWLTTCAALELDAAPPLLQSWARTGHTNASLHSLCTPLLAVSTLEAMEALHLEGSPWYAAYDTHVAQSLQEMLKVESQRGVLEDDAQTAERTLFLASASENARAAATALLGRAVERLDAVLTGSSGTGDDASTAAATQSRSSTQPVFSFQQRSLSRQAEVAAVEERLLRYCVALQRGSEAGASKAHAAAS